MARAFTQAQKCREVLDVEAAALSYSGGRAMPERRARPLGGRGPASHSRTLLIEQVNLVAEVALVD
jgi:hypothetical protein